MEENLRSFGLSPLLLPKHFQEQHHFQVPSHTGFPIEMRPHLLMPKWVDDVERQNCRFCEEGSLPHSRTFLRLASRLQIVFVALLYILP